MSGTLGQRSDRAAPPLIGITGRRLHLGLVRKMDRRFEHRLTDTFMSDFARCVGDAGASPVLLPFEFGEGGSVDRLDGLVLTGGQDVHPESWGGDPSVVRPVNPRDDPTVHDAERDLHEIRLARAALDLGLPILAVCRGLQVLNVALGGNLVQELPETEVEHYPPDGPLTDGRADHVVSFAAGSTAAGLYGARAVTNSWHHQSVDQLGEGLVVSGWTSDGVVESAEMPDRPVLGVQWHPEWMVRHEPVFDWLVSRSRERSASTV